MTRTQYLVRRWRRQTYDWLNAHDIDPRGAAILVAAIVVALLYIGQRLGA